MAARYTAQIGHRAPGKRRLKARHDAHDAAWLKAIEEAQATRADLAVSVAIDGLALVDSRTVQDASHEVRVIGGRAVSCTCLAHRTRGVCPHRAYVALRLWQDQMGADLWDVPARALVTTLVNGYLEAPRTPRLVGPAARDWTTDPERRLEETA